MSEEIDSEENNFTIITFANLDATQKQLIHTAVKGAAISWWHQQELVWIVQGGGRVLEWRDRLAPFVRGMPNSGLLALSLPMMATERGWATSGGSGYSAWIKSTYRPRPDATTAELSAD